jgi:hypothetical protein
MSELSIILRQPLPTKGVHVMIDKPNKQFDFFSKQQSLWQKQSTETKNQLHDQLALLLLFCFKPKDQLNQPLNKESQPCPVK